MMLEVNRSHIMELGGHATRSRTQATRPNAALRCTMKIPTQMEDLVIVRSAIDQIRPSSAIIPAFSAINL